MDLILDRVKKIFKNTIVVDDVSIRMQSGIYGLLGSNGAGKTTLYSYETYGRIYLL